MSALRPIVRRADGRPAWVDAPPRQRSRVTNEEWQARHDRALAGEVEAVAAVIAGCMGRAGL